MTRAVSERKGGTPDRPMTRVSWPSWSPDDGRALEESSHCDEGSLS